MTRSMVENVARDVGDQFVAEGETENVSRGAESTEKQCGKMSRQTVHSPPHQGSITINQQDMNDGHDSDHLHSINSHFSQDDQKSDNPSSSSHDTRPFPLSNAITSVHLTTWGPNVRCHNQGGRLTGSTDTSVVVPTRGVARASQIWKDSGYDRIIAPLFWPPSCSVCRGRAVGEERISSRMRCGTCVQGGRCQGDHEYVHSGPRFGRVQQARRTED